MRHAPPRRKLRLIDLLALAKGAIREPALRRPRSLAVDEVDPAPPHLPTDRLRGRVVREIDPAEEKEQVDGVVRPARRLPRVGLVDQVPVHRLLGCPELVGDDLDGERVARVVDEVECTQFSGRGTVRDDVVQFSEFGAPLSVLFEGCGDGFAVEELDAVSPDHGLESALVI